MITELINYLPGNCEQIGHANTNQFSPKKSTVWKSGIWEMPIASGVPPQQGACLECYPAFTTTFLVILGFQAELR